MKKLLFLFASFSTVFCSYSQGVMHGPSSPRFLLLNPSSLSARDHNIKGKPFSITTSSAQTKLIWGEEVLERGTRLDSITFNKNGLVTEFLNKVEDGSIYGTVHYSNRLDSISINPVDYNEVSSFDPYQSYTVIYNWVRQDSLILDFVRPNGEVISKMKYKLKPDEVSVTTYRTSHSTPEISTTCFIDNKGFVSRKSNQGNDYLKLGENIPLSIPPFITDQFRKSGILPFQATNVYRSGHSGFYVNIKKDANNRIVKLAPSQTDINQLLTNASGASQPSYATYEFIYDDNDNVIKEIVTIYTLYYSPQNRKKHWGHKIFENTYDYVYDKYGNWTQVHFINSNSKREYNSRESYYLLRNIIYYDSPEYEKIISALHKEEIKREEKIYSCAEESAKFPGGEGALMKWLAKNIHYPDELANQGISGKVWISFIVEKDGSLTNAEIQKSPNEILSNEVIRIINTMPKWIPAKNNGHSVRFRQQIPIVFKSQAY